MAQDTLRAFRNELTKLLGAAYLEHDKNSMSPNGKTYDAIVVRLDTIKEIAKLAGVHRIERRRCAMNSCGVILSLDDTSRYCSNACKQKAYRQRHGQMRL